MTEVPLRSYCPSSCACGSKQIKDWYHAKCMTRAYLSDRGDISCSRGCLKYFIQHINFRCSQSNQWEQYKSGTQFLMALSSAMVSANFSLGDYQKVRFITTLNQQVVQRWSH